MINQTLKKFFVVEETSYAAVFLFSALRNKFFMNLLFRTKYFNNCQ